MHLSKLARRDPFKTGLRNSASCGNARVEARFASGPRTRLYARVLMATWRVTPIMVAPDRGRIARVITYVSPCMYTELVPRRCVKALRRSRDLARHRPVSRFISYVMMRAARVFLADLKPSN